MRFSQRLVATTGAMVLVAGTVVVAAPASAAPTVVPTKVYKACADKDSGAIRLIVKGKKCKKNERKMEWNVQGPAGMAGPVGATGAMGATGAQGIQGLPGTNGTNGTNGVDGAFIWRWTWSAAGVDPTATTTTFPAGTRIVPMSPTLSMAGCTTATLIVSLPGAGELARWNGVSPGTGIPATSVTSRVSPADGTPLTVFGACDGFTDTDIAMNFTFSTPTPIT